MGAIQDQCALSKLPLPSRLCVVDIFRLTALPVAVAIAMISAGGIVSPVVAGVVWSCAVSAQEWPCIYLPRWAIDLADILIPEILMLTGRAVLRGQTVLACLLPDPSRTNGIEISALRNPGG